MRTLAILLATALLGLGGTAAGDEPSELAAAAPPADAYPDADAVVLLSRVDYVIDGDGRLSRHVLEVRKLLTEWAVRGTTDHRLAWDSTRQDLTVQVCRTLGADGRVVDTPPRGLNEVTPDAVAHSAPFLGFRELVASHVGVAVGDVVVLEYTVRDREPGPLPPGGLEFLPERDPVLEKRISVRAPAGALRSTVAGPTAGFDLHLEEDPAAGVVELTVCGLAAASPEIGAPGRGDHQPYLLFSTCPDWRTLGERLGELTASAVGEAPAADGWRDDPATDLTELETVEAVQELLHARIRTVHPAGGGWTRPPRPAREVLATACGTPWEKANLALALLEAAGLHGELAFFSRWDGLAAEVATPLSLDDVRVVVPVAGANWWLGPDLGSPRRSRCDLAGRAGLFLEDTDAQLRTYRVPRTPGEADLAVEVTPDGDAFRARIDYQATGPLLDALAGWSVERIANALAAAVLPGAEPEDTEIIERSDRQLHLRLAARGDRLGEERGGLREVAIPAPPLGVLALLPAGTSAATGPRRAPFMPPAALAERLVYRLRLPPGLVVAACPDGAAETRGEARFVLTSGREDGVLSIRRELVLPAGPVAPADFADYRAVAAAAAAPATGRILLAEE